ncbi:hypothetical protein OKW98_18345 [Pseudomonas sp. KU26590]|uniref:hypothetical protein n=1 Tax=Pseudomonas sp. KU26590 TaxID=2991051 RepID=UPI00223E0097|nr:hypothetical protein [Pseudomonas sp. KU26590]UZJ58539.1 hypothetical protein OKW98_18345 [Pseudomonas sp. KU26590]
MRTDQYIAGPLGIVTIALKANGGSLKVEKQVGDDWVASDTFAQDGAWRLNLGYSQTRFTPAGGAAFEVYP